MDMQIRTLLLLAALLTVLPSFGQKTSIAVFANGASYRSTSVDRYIPLLGFFEDTVTAKFQSRTGYGFCLDRALSPHVTAELSAQRLRMTALVHVSDTFTRNGTGKLGTISLNNVAAALQWHFAPAGRYDPYLGAGVARIEGGPLNQLGRPQIDPQMGPSNLDDKWTWIAQGGVNLQLTPKSAVMVQAGYLRYSSSYGGPEHATVKHVRLDPVTVALGLRWRV